MRPYYEHGGITIYHADYREVLPDLGRFDLLLTDPPYGLGKRWSDTKERTSKRRWVLQHRNVRWDDEVADVSEILPVADKQIIWGGHLMGLPTVRGWLVWNKIIRNWSSGVCELAWTNLDIPIDAFDYSHGQLANEGKLHPTQKPLPLVSWCIQKAGEIQTIIDPFAGSGTTGRAAKDLGKTATLIEREERYCEIAATRLGQEAFDFGDVA